MLPRTLPTLLLASLATLALAPTGLAPARAAGPDCADPQPGRYVVMGQGEAMGEPVARLLQETWTADGRIQGVRLERRGRSYAESTYTGSFQPRSECRVAIERSYGSSISRSQAVLDPSGHPRYSLPTVAEVVLASSWIRQPEGKVCNAGLLDGTVVSMQQGLSRRDGRWRPNAVVQHEQWRQGKVTGIALSSYGATIEEALYDGNISVSPDCLATVKQKDSLNRSFNYRAIVLADGSGYLYLQTDPDDLTIGRLDRISTP
jgi:hypothetical protein